MPGILQGQTVACPHCEAQTALTVPASMRGMVNAPAAVEYKGSNTPLIAMGIVLAVVIGVSLFFKPAAMAGAAGIALFLLAVAVGLIIYFLPSFIGRKKRNATAITVLNILLGWTFIGWVVALVWACTKDK